MVGVAAGETVSCVIGSAELMLPHQLGCSHGFVATRRDCKRARLQLVPGWRRSSLNKFVVNTSRAPKPDLRCVSAQRSIHDAPPEATLEPTLFPNCNASPARPRTLRLCDG